MQAVGKVLHENEDCTTKAASIVAVEQRLESGTCVRHFKTEEADHRAATQGKVGGFLIAIAWSDR
jgi:hypothetical protein